MDHEMLCVFIYVLHAILDGAAQSIIHPFRLCISYLGITQDE